MCGPASVASGMMVVTSPDSSSDIPPSRRQLYGDPDPKETGQSWWLAVDSPIPPFALKVEQLLTSVTPASKGTLWFSGDGLTSLLQKESSWQLRSQSSCARPLRPG